MFKMLTINKYKTNNQDEESEDPVTLNQEKVKNYVTQNDNYGDILTLRTIIDKTTLISYETFMTKLRGTLTTCLEENPEPKYLLHTYNDTSRILTDVLLKDTIPSVIGNITTYRNKLPSAKEITVLLIVEKIAYGETISNVVRENLKGKKVKLLIVAPYYHKCELNLPEGTQVKIYYDTQVSNLEELGIKILPRMSSDLGINDRDIPLFINGVNQDTELDFIYITLKD